MKTSYPAYRLIWRLMCYAPRLYALDTILWIGINGLFPAIPGLVIRQYFNTLEGSSTASAWVWIWVLLAAACGHVLVIFIGRFTKTQHRFTVRSLLYHNLFAGVLARPGAQPMMQEGRVIAPGEVLSTFRHDVQEIEDMVVGVSELTAQGLFAVISLIILVSVNATVTLLVFIPLLVIIAIVQGLAARIKQYRRTGRQATARVTGAVSEIFSSVQAIKVAGAEQSVLSHLRRVNDERQQAMVRDQLLTTLLESLFVNLVSLGTGLILIVIALTGQVGSGAFRVGDVALFVYYLIFIGTFLGFFGAMVARYRQSEVSFERMHHLLPSVSPDAVVEHQPLYLKPLLGKQPPLPPMPSATNDHNRLQELSLRDVTFRYPETGGGIQRVSFAIKAGELVVITGRIGAGKTTLLRVLQGLLPAQSGQIFWNNTLVDDPQHFFKPPHSAYVPQTPTLFSLTLEENLRLGQDMTPEELAEAIHLAVFDRDIVDLPAGLTTQIGAKGTRLSGGQRQRLAAARALGRRPDLLIVDDLSSALDVQTEQMLWQRLRLSSNRHNTSDMAILAVSHRRAALQRADRIVVLHEGEIEAIGTLSELQAHSPTLQTIWQMPEAPPDQA
ncbi:MAG: ABC transporter ATP-binding protein [Chloroflexota bacterium]